MIRDKCLICESNNLKEIIDLGMHPFADTFIPESKKSEPDKIYPLVCDLCLDCGSIQNKYETNPLDRYSNIEYSYTSSNSAFSRKHWDDFAKEVSDKIKLKQGAIIVEAGSNDGYLSEQFIKLGFKSVGVDPSPHMAELSKQRGVNTVVGLFGAKTSETVLSNYGKADLVVANNVFNHSDNPLEFTRSVENILNDEGVFVFEQPYWVDTLKSGKFDQIYHEHVSYFTVKSAKALLNRANMVIIHAEIVDYHGGSLRIYSKKKEFAKEADIVNEMITDEENYGTFDQKTYQIFMNKKISQKNLFLQRICKLKEEGYKIIAVGAAAKGNTFLNFSGLNNSLIDYVTDASPHKKGKYTPATRIPIVGDEIFAKFDKVYALILSWNIAKQLKEKLAEYNKNIEFISPDETSNGIKDVVHQKRGIEHEDERRSIRTAFNGDFKDFKAAQTKIYDVRQEIALAGHYHNYIEMFYMLDGQATFFLKDVETGETKECVLNNMETLLIPPKVAHKVIPKVGTKMIGFTEKPFISTEINDVKYEF